MHPRNARRFATRVVLPSADEVYGTELRKVWSRIVPVRLAFIRQENHAVSPRDLLDQAVNAVSATMLRRV
jgi:hypothetical protein